jgi:amidase
MKPSRARVSLAPEFGDFFSGLVQELVVSRSVRDAASVLDWVAGPAPGDPYAAPAPARAWSEELGTDPGRLRVGLMTTAPGSEIQTHPDCVEAAEDAARLLESLGHLVEPSYPAAVDDPYVESFLVRWSSGVDWELKYWSAKTGREIGPGDVEPATWALAEMGRSHSGGDYLRAVEHHQAVTRRAAQWWEEGFDLLLTPTMSEPPTPLGAFEAEPGNPLFPVARATPVVIFCAGMNVSGQPAISLPLHWSDDGLPIGVQLVAAYGREDLLLRVASQVEEARPWADRRPPLFAGQLTG